MIIKFELTGTDLENVIGCLRCLRQDLAEAGPRRAKRVILDLEAQIFLLSVKIPVFERVALEIVLSALYSAPAPLVELDAVLKDLATVAAEPGADLPAVLNKDLN